MSLRIVLLPLIFLSISFAYSILFKKEINKTLIISFLSSILLLYVFGLFNKLILGTYFIIIIFFIAFVFDIYYLIKNHKNFFEILKEYVFTPGFIIFIALAIVIILIQRGKMFTNWDEFSHWADVVKSMFYNNVFSTSAQANSAFQSYPPFMSLFQYLCCKIYGRYSEGLLFISYDLLLLSLFIPFINKYNKKENIIIYFLKISIYLIVIFLIPTIFVGNYYNQIYIDSAVGIMFGYLIANIYLTSEYDLFFFINICLSLIAVILFKDVGLMFAIISAICIIINLFSKSTNKSLKKKILLCLLIISVILFAKISWTMNIKLNNANVAFSDPINYTEIVDLLLKKDTTYRMQVLVNYKHAILNDTSFTGGIFSLSLKELVVISFVILTIIFLKNKQQKNKCNLIILFIGFLGYIVGLAFLYCFKFSEYEALNLASWQRYICIYLDSIITFVILIIIYKNYSIKQNIIMLFSILLVTSVTGLKNSITYAKTSQQVMLTYVEQENYIKSVVKNNEIVFFISQGDNGFEYWVMKYRLRPINNPQDKISRWSFGKPYYDGDIWTYDITLSDLLDKVLTYDYVYVSNSNDGLINDYGSMFVNKKDIKSKSLYKVDKEHKKLIYVGTAKL